MAIRLGINPITWTNDDLPSLGGDTPVETCLAETREAGFAGTEMGGKFPKTSGALGPLLAKLGLVLVSGWYDGRIHEREPAAEWDAILPHLTLLKDMGCRQVVYADTSGRSEGDLFAPISKRPKLADGDWAAYGKRLTALAERMADFGVGMAFHHHMGTIVETDQRGRPPDGLDRPGGRPALRLRPFDLFRRRSACTSEAARRPRRACALQGRAAGCSEACAGHRRKLHAGGARRRLHHARRRFYRLRGAVLDSPRRRLFGMGGGGGRARSGEGAIPSLMHGWDFAISRASR